MKAKNAASAATVEPIAGKSQLLTAISPTSVTGQKIVGKIVCGHVPGLYPRDERRRLVLSEDVDPQWAVGVLQPAVIDAA